MEKKIKLLKSALATDRTSRKNLLLSVVALVLVVMTMIVSTFSWIETTSSIRIYTEKVKEDEVNPYVIDTRTNYLANMSVATSETDIKEIDLTKYFRESGNVHLAPALSADGETFYFPKVNSDKYRKGNINDKNVNYISFSFKVKATGNTYFYFDSVPEIKSGDEDVAANSVRFAITADNTTKIYSNTDEIYEEEIGINGNNLKTTVHPFSSSLKNDAVSPVFYVPNGQTKIITISMWLHKDSETKYQSINVNEFKLIASSSKNTALTFVDKTTSFNGVDNGYGWVQNHSAEMWVAVGDAIPVKMTKSTGGTWSSAVSITDTSANIKFYRCSPNTNASDVKSSRWNEWSTTLTEASAANSYTYTAYSGTEKDANGVDTQKGYGTWKNVVEYTLDSESSSVLLKPETASNATEVIFTAGSYNCNMNYHNNKWRGFVPVSDTDTPTVEFTINDNIITAEPKPATEYDYTITSASTGYWGTPVIISVGYVNGSTSSMGTPKVKSGDLVKTDSIKVTKGTTVTLQHENKKGYILDAWYGESDAINKLTTTTIKADENRTCYANFEKAIYFVPSDNWKIDNARFAYYAFNNDTDTKWCSMTLDADGRYVAKYPNGYSKIIFVRMNSNSTTNNWDNAWNQTDDLTLSSDKNLFTMNNNNDWDNKGTWSLYSY